MLLCLFILAEVNYPHLAPQSELALFAMFGLIVVFLRYPIHSRFEGIAVFQILDVVLIGSVIFCFGYVVVQTEPVFQDFWLDGKSLGDRAGAELSLDYIVGGIGLVLVLEATRRSIGIALPLLSFIFLLYASFGQFMPDWLFPHRGYSLQRIVSQTFLHSQGTFGVALRVMFTYVFLFVLFGTLLERTGATGYVLNLARRVFGSSAPPRCPCEGRCIEQRYDGVVVGVRRGEHRYDRNVYDSVDATHRVSTSDRRRHRSRGEFWWRPSCHPSWVPPRI